MTWKWKWVVLTSSSSESRGLGAEYFLVCAAILEEASTVKQKKRTHQKCAGKNESYKGEFLTLHKIQVTSDGDI